MEVCSWKAKSHDTVVCATLNMTLKAILPVFCRCPINFDVKSSQLKHRIPQCVPHRQKKPSSPAAKSVLAPSFDMYSDVVGVSKNYMLLQLGFLVSASR